MRRYVRFLLLLMTVMLAAVSMSAQEEQRIFYSFDSSNGLADNSAQTLKCTKTGRIVITTIGHVNFYDGANFSHIDPQPEDAFPLPKYNGHYHLYFDLHHHLWLKDKYSVTCVDLLTERFVRNISEIIRGLGMQRHVDDMFCDNDNHLWFLSEKELHGTDDQQIVPVSQRAELQDVDVYDRRHLLQFYGDGSVTAYDLKTGRHLYDAAAFNDADSLRYTNSSVIYPDKDFFYQIRNGEKESVLLRFDALKHTWERLLTMPYHLNNMVKYKGKLYIASEYGYWTYDIASGKTEHIEYLQLTMGRRLLTDVNTVAFDRQGGMWLGTEKRGLLYSKPIQSPFITYTWDQPEAIKYAEMIDAEKSTPQLLPRHVNCKVRDSRGWTWTGLYTGLHLVKADGKTTRTYTKRDGLMNEMIHSVIEDDNHDIWVSTSFGISHLFIRGDSVYHVESYNTRDNVPNESFVNDRAIKLADGTIVMQSLDHIVTFNPQKLQTGLLSEMKMYPKLIRLMVNGNFVTAGTEINGKPVIDRAVSRIWEISVDHSQNNLSLTFSALNFMRPLQTYYRVRVRGISDEWKIWSFYNSNGQVDTNGLLHIPLLGLAPGTYVIEIQTSMTPDSWPMEPLSWIIHVKEPWWRSTGIYLLLAFLILALVVANFLIFNSNTRKRMIFSKEEEDIVKRIRSYAKHCEQMAADELPDTNGPVKTDDAPEGSDVSAGVDDEYNEAMLKIISYLDEREDKPVTVRELSELTGVEMGRLLEMLSANLYKSPYHLAVLLRNRFYGV